MRPLVGGASSLAQPSDACVCCCQMGILQNPAFKITFVLDRTSMFSVQSRMKDGKIRTHEVKPLQYIWAKFPQYNAANTVHVDDLSRNFAMNPKQVTSLCLASSSQVFVDDYCVFRLIHWLVGTLLTFCVRRMQGLKISAFRESVRIRKKDRELFFLAHYLVHIALHVPDFVSLKHSAWAAYVAENVPGLTG